jgi:hypothetical protein
MERSWFVNVRLMELEIGLMVAIALMALVVITARIARDPSEFAVRRWLDRARTAEPTARPPLQPVTEPQANTPEWLDRLLRRDPQPLERPSGSTGDQQGTESGRRVA